MTDEKIKGQGCCNRCPRCKSDDINAYDYNGYFDGMSCKVNCDNCDLTWTEYYKADHWETWN